MELFVNVKGRKNEDCWGQFLLIVSYICISNVKSIYIDSNTVILLLSSSKVKYYSLINLTSAYELPVWGQLGAGKGTQGAVPC